MRNKSGVSECRSILKDVNELIDIHLDLKGIGTSPHHKHKSSCRDLTDRPRAGLDVSVLIGKIYDKVRENWDNAKRHCKSEKNWRFEPQTGISAKNDSPEVRFERAIVSIPEEVWKDASNWVNQVPTVSGLVDPDADRGRRIDLVHKSGTSAYELIELKVASDTPLYAAMEILKYAVLYVFCRQDRRVSRYIDRTRELLKAEKIHLRVLAPSIYYEKYDLSWLEARINSGLSSFRAERQLPFEMDFKFEGIELIQSRTPVAWKP